MPIPELIQFEEWKVLINQKFIDFNEFVNWSPERQIEVLYKLAKDCIYWNSNFSDEKIEKSMQWFNWAYWLAKLKFQDIKRNTWWRYFDHLINVMQYVVTNSKNPTIKKNYFGDDFVKKAILGNEKNSFSNHGHHGIDFM